MITTDDGIALHVEETGAGEPLLFIHEAEAHVIADAALAGHDATGAALTMRGIQAARPSLYELDYTNVAVPLLILTGDEDDGCQEPALMLKRAIATAGLVILPRTGHTANREEPGVFNSVVDDFLAAVARGAWKPRVS